MPARIMHEIGAQFLFTGEVLCRRGLTR
jgi:hypothetical protein